MQDTNSHDPCAAIKLSVRDIEFTRSNVQCFIGRYRTVGNIQRRQPPRRVRARCGPAAPRAAAIGARTGCPRVLADRIFEQLRA